MMLHTPGPDCPLCPRLVAHRAANRIANPGWHNAPVPGWGDPEASLLILGLAPGRTGANRTGRPFNGDSAGATLFAALGQAGRVTATGLDGVFLTNAVLCAPPDNRPTKAELRTCRVFLVQQLKALPRVRTILALGHSAHEAAIKAFGAKLQPHRFAHGAVHRLPFGARVIDSYHPSRLNTQTGRLTLPMLVAVLALALS